MQREIKRITDFVEPREKRIEILEKENRILKCFIKDLFYENHNTCSQFSNTTCLFNSDYRNRAEELIGEKLSLGNSQWLKKFHLEKLGR